MSSSGRYFVYILASRKYGTLYIGMTSDLVARTYIHREDILAGFSSRYRVHNLVYLEQHETALGAIAREKQLKKWRRERKLALIAQDPPGWRDLYAEIAS